MGAENGRVTSSKEAIQIKCNIRGIMLHARS